MKFDDKHVIITGGAGGIGAAMGRLFAKQGARVVVSDLKIEAAQELADEIGGLALPCDVADEGSVIDLIEQAQTRFGPVDLFCSNAGFGAGEKSHAASASNDVWQKNWDVHVMAHVYASRALLPAMIERGDGYLLNIASAAGLLMQVGDSAYSATKAAAVSFAQSLAVAHGGDGVKVSVVCPQYVNTDILAISEEQRAQPMKDVLTPEDCAKVILDGIENEDFMIMPHPQVRDFMANRGSDPDAWIDGMRRYRKAVLNQKGQVDFTKILSGLMTD